MQARRPTIYDRPRLPGLGGRLREEVAWDRVPWRALRLLGDGVGVSSGGSLTAMGIPKNCSSRASADRLTMAVALRDTVTVPWLLRCSMCICPDWRAISMSGECVEQKICILGKWRRRIGMMRCCAVGCK